MAKRLFTAIRYTPSEEIKEIIRECRNMFADEKIKWTEIDHLHITLKFLGDTEEELIPKLIKVYKRIASENQTFDMQIRSLGAFYRGKLPSILFLKSENSETLNKMVLKISDRSSELGFKKEERKFNAHITLARIKYINAHNLFKEILKIKCEQSLQVDSFFLFESKLKQSGPIYSIINEFKFDK